MKVLPDNVVSFPKSPVMTAPGMPLVTPAEPPRVMTSTAEADIKRHLAGLEAFKDDPEFRAAFDRIQKAVRLAGFAFGGAFVVLVFSLLAFTVGYLIGGMR